MKSIKYIFFLLIFGALFAQETTDNAKIKLGMVKINGEIVESEDIILSDSSKISFYYSASVDKSLQDDPFLFHVSLSNSTDEASKDWNEPQISYSGLPEDEYEFSVSAFDLQKRWETEKRIIKFSVNNRQAKLVDQINQLRDTIYTQDTLIASLSNRPVEVAETDSMELWIYFGLGFASASILFFLVYIFLLPKKEGNSNSKKSKNKAKKTEDSSRIDLFKLENQELKDEIAQMKEQMENLQEKTEEMKSQNRELEDNVRKLSTSKEELENLQNQKDELFAMLIHDIKNPAGIIKSLVELLRSYDLSAIDQQKIIDDIINTTSKIMSLSNEVARVLALESGHLQMEFETTKLPKLCRDIYDRFLVKAKEKQILMMYEVPNDIPDIEADEGRLDEVMSNIVSNAIKFTQSGGTIRLKGQVIDDSIVIEVSDNGQGLSQDDLTHAFKKGAQLSAKPTAGESSTGLGLWIVKKLVEAHEGKVWVRSSLGKGSTFAFSLPTKQKNNPGLVKL